MSYNDVRRALGAAAKVYEPDINVYYYTPRTLTPPAVIVQPAHRTISYLQAQSSRLAQWNFIVLVIIGQVDEIAAQEQAGELISPGSPLIQAFNDVKLNGYVQVTEGSIAEVTIGGGVYTHVQLSVTVCSP